MKTNRMNKKNSLGRKALVMALAFMMIMQFNCLTVASAWADTEETAIAQNEILQEEGIKEEALVNEAPVLLGEVQIAPQQEEVKELAEKAEAPEQEVKEEIKEEVKAEEVKAEAQAEVKTEVQEEVKEEAAAPENKEEAVKAETEKEAVQEAAEEPAQEAPAAPALIDMADGKLTVHITNILYINRTRPESSVDGKAVPWEYTFTISKNGSKAISHNGTYSYVGGATASASGQGFKAKFLQGFVLATPSSGIVRGDSLDGFRTIQRIANTKGESVTVTFTDGTTEIFKEADIYISPVYSIEENWVMYYNMIDRVSTGSGSWNNANGSATSYTKTFKDPSVGTPKAHYRFINWYNEDKDQYFAAGEKDKYTNDMFRSGEVRTVNVFAIWQPSVTVNYSVLGRTVKSAESFEGIDIYGYAPLNQDENTQFAGWFDEEGNLISEDAVYSAPALTGIEEEVIAPAVHTVYAGFTTNHTVKIIWDDQDREDSLRAESIETVLIENGEETELTETLSEENDWTYTFSGLNAYNADNSKTDYTAEELTVLGNSYDIAVNTIAETCTTVINLTFRPSITLTAASDSWTFDGEEHSNSEVTLTSGSLYEGDELIAIAAGKVMNEEDTEEGNNIVAEYKIFRGDEDVTSKYNITLEAGTLEILAAPVIEEPVIEEPVIEEPVIEEPVIEEPVIEEPVIEEPVIEEPVIEEPVIEEPVIEEPVIEEPAIEEPVIEEPAIEEPEEEAPATIEEPQQEPQDEEVIAETEVHEEEINEEAPVSGEPEEKPADKAPAKEDKADSQPASDRHAEDDDDDEIAPAVTTRPAAPQSIEAATAPKAAPADTVNTANAASIEEEITEEAVPTAAGTGAWAILNLMAAVLSAVLSLVLLVLGLTGRDHRFEAAADAAEGGEENKEIKRKGLLRILSLIPAIASIVIFILTEDLSQPMVLADRWTALMAVLLAVTALLAILSKKTERNAEEA